MKDYLQAFVLAAVIITLIGVWFVGSIVLGMLGFTTPHWGFAVGGAALFILGFAAGVAAFLTMDS